MLSHSMVLAKNVMAAEMRTSNGGSSLGGTEELAYWFVTWSSGMQVGATTKEKFIVFLLGWKSQVWP
jgi:hypothetical protein